MPNLLVFENDSERTMMCAISSHDWENQKNIFGRDTNYVLRTAQKLFRAAIRMTDDDTNKLFGNLCHVAKRHHVYITWYGNSTCACEPDRYLISGRGEERLAFIQC